MRRSEIFISNSTHVYCFRDFKDYERRLSPDMAFILEAHYVKFQVKYSHFCFDKILNTRHILVESAK